MPRPGPGDPGRVEFGGDEMFNRKRSVLPFLLPGLIGLFVFYIIPFLGGIYYSFTDGSYKNAFVWFDNYKAVMNNPMFQLGLKNTMLFSAICTPLVWALSFLIAMLLNRIKPRGAFFRNSVILPYFMPSCAILLIWLVLFDYGGVVNRFVVSLGLDRVSWLEGAAMRVPVILLFVWKNLGLAIIIFLAAMQSIPEPLYEYAKLEGAGFFRQAWHVTLPLIVPSSFLVFVLCWINSFKIFKEVYFIGGAYPDEAVYTLQNYMNNMFSKLNYQNVTTAAYIFALIVFAIFGIIYLVQRWLLKRMGQEGA
jgi:multiple sugar transport system permease protein